MRKIGMLLALSMMMGGMNGMTMPAPKVYTPREPEPQPDITPKERIESALSLISKENAERLSSFPKWKTHVVDGVEVVASNMKNAIRHYQRAMRQYGLN